jgi:hypothetical protein
MNYAVLQAIGTEADFALAQKAGGRKDLLPSILGQEWAKFDLYIARTTANVQKAIDLLWSHIETVTARLLDAEHRGKIWGDVGLTTAYRRTYPLRTCGHCLTKQEVTLRFSRQSDPLDPRRQTARNSVARTGAWDSPSSSATVV